MAAKIRAVHYLNQFFGGLGGEDKADEGPHWFDGPKGPGNLMTTLAPDIEIVGTVAAGDNYMNADLEARAAEIVALIESHAAEFDLLLAGPAFNAGRYGVACGAVCKAVQERFEVPAVTALYDENPAVEIYRKSVTIVRAGSDVMAMKEAAGALARVGLKRARGEAVDPATEGVVPKGVRQNYFAEATGAVRAVEMLMRKLEGRDPETEYAMPVFDRVPPAPPVADMSQAVLALVTSGGIVPRGNPDRIESASASRYGEYPLAGLDALSAETHQTVHGGYDPTYANQDPNRVLPLDVVRQLEREGKVGRLHDSYFATVGNATSVERARGFGAEIAAKLLKVGVQAVILTST